MHDQAEGDVQIGSGSEDAPAKASGSTRELMETFDWASTSLGPREQWPQSLLTTVSVMENLEHETQLMWGSDYVTLYNDAYAKMAGPKHPAIYGLPCGEAWPEIWEYMKPNADSVMAGTPIYRTSDQFFFATGPNGSLQESHHLWLWTPVKVEGGKVGGILSQSLEQTAKVLAERRLGVLSHLTAGSVGARSTEELFRHLLLSLALEPHDVPFALIYNGNLTSTEGGSLNLSLAGVLGAPADHSSAPSNIAVSLDPASPSAGGWPIAEALKTGAPVLVKDCKALIDNFEVRSWELPSQALVIPVHDAESAQRTILIIGLNSRRPFDDAYREWTGLLRHQIQAGLTSTRFIEAQLKREEELAQLDRAKTTFFSNISHELRTPLTLIRGPITDLIADEFNSEKRELLEMSMRNVKRLQRLVDMLMDVSRVDAGRMAGAFRPHQIGVFVQDLAAMFRSAIEKGGLKFVVDCDKTDTRLVYIDGDLFEKVVWNLLSNAYKYCLEGKISVHVKYLDNDVEVTVADTGIGIPLADVPLVKERFHRVSSVSRSHEGTGIGLSLASDLVHIHGGKLLIESTTAEESPSGEHGSTFRVLVPYGHAHLPSAQVQLTADPDLERARSARTTIWMDDQIVSERNSQSEGKPSQATSTSSVSSAAGYHGSVVSSSRTPLRPALTSDSSFRVSETSILGGASTQSSIASSGLLWTNNDTVLICDDNKDMRRYLRSVFEKHVKVIEARDGQEALDLAQRHLPDLIVSDVMMPNLDGFGMVTALRKSEGEAAWCPVILITARAGENEKIDGLLIGAEDYLVKPFTSKELVARAHLQMQIGKTRISLERRFNARSEELRLRAIEAEERRRLAEFERKQQELLVDVCSHETRNTNSAIFHLTASCRDSLKDLLARVESDAGFTDRSALLETINEELESLESITSLAASQERISNDILSLASIQGSTLALYPHEVDLAKVLEQSLSSFEVEATTTDVDLQLSFGDNLKKAMFKSPFIVRIDDVRLKQIYGNLVSNALKFTANLPHRHIRVFVDIHQHPPSDTSCLPPSFNDQSAFDPQGDVYIYGAVEDNGIGLSPESLGLLFQRFSQASTTTHAQFGGSGLGLFISRKLCELMDGKIEVVSKEGAGSTFRFFIKNTRLEALSPFGEPEDPIPPMAPAVPPSPVAISTPSALISAEDAKPMHVLVVEDNLINQKVLRKQLLKAGISSDVASDGQEAIRLLVERSTNPSELRYDTVLMDLEMPVMGGIEATTKIREMEATGEVFTQRHTIFALTGNARQWQLDRAREVGMDDTFVKPYKLPELLARLRSVQRQ